MSSGATKRLTAQGLLRLAPDLLEASGLPVHVRIEQWLMHAMDERDLVPGDKLPHEAQMAADLGVSRMTLRQALASLEAKGLLDRRRGRNGGNFIAQPKLECDLTGLAGFTEQMRRAHVRAGARVIEARTAQAPTRVAAGLEIARNAKVHKVVRVRSVKSEPLALEHSYLPAKYFPDLLTHRLTGSLYTLLRKRYGQTPHTAQEELEPVIADDEQARLLRIAPGSPLMGIHRIAYTPAGLPIEFAWDLFRPDRVRITLRSGVQTQLLGGERPRAESAAKAVG